MARTDWGFIQDAPYRTTVLDPCIKMCSYFPIINDTIAKRNKKVGVERL
jgi:hypothetical protein